MNSFIKRYIKFSYIIATIISVFLLFYQNPKPLILGLFFGLTIRCLLFKLSAIDLDKILNHTPNNAKKSAMINYFKRFLFYGIALAISEKSEYLNIYTCALGLVVLSWSIHLINFFDIYRSNKL